MQDRILRLTHPLSEQGKYHLADVIGRYWDYSAREYMDTLFEHNPDFPIEDALGVSFSAHLLELGYSDQDVDRALNYITNRRCLQTSPHIGPTQSARMLCINWMTQLPLTEREPLMVGYYSGIPFSNSSRPGRLIYHTESIQLIPARMQDTLVYRSHTPEKLLHGVSLFSEELFQKTLPKTSEPYTNWALRFTHAIESEIFADRHLVFFDINDVASRYMSEILYEPSHILYRILFDRKVRNIFVDAFGENMILFYKPYTSGKYEKSEVVKLTRDGLCTAHELLDFESDEKIIAALRKRELCPATFLVFAIFSFLNGIRTFGSFRQIEYLTRFKELWEKSGLLDDQLLTHAKTHNLTTGSFSDPILNCNNLEAYKYGEWNPDPEILMGELWLNIEDVLLKS